jgi:general secretion pathway protein E
MDFASLAAAPVGEIPAGSFTHSWLVDVLAEQNVLDAAGQQKATRHLADPLAAPSRDNPAQRLASLGLRHAQDNSLLDEAALMRVVAQATQLPFAPIDPLQLDLQWVTQALSRPFALRHAVLPLCQQDGVFWLALADPFAADLLRSIAQTVRLPLRPVLACRSEILRSLQHSHGFIGSVDAAVTDQRHDALFNVEQLVRLRPHAEPTAGDAPIVAAVDHLFAYAFDQRASDIHIEPRREFTQIRLRIDGILHDVHTLPRRVHSAILSRLKTLGRMDIAERRRPQDGRIKTVRPEGTVELRVSTLPTAFGEKAVLRVFDPATRLQGLADLGLQPAALATFSRWVGQPHGLVLVTGPTGSGKTTTLYASLQSLADRRVNVTSIEDPIEMVVDLFNQVAVQPKAGLDFPQALRAILRQDPDVIMVGEIRDAPTAQLSVQAALTGHLVLSTLHTDDAAHAVARLTELGVPAFSVRAALHGVMAQRLLRRLCPQCKKPAPQADRGIGQLLGLSPKKIDDLGPHWEGVGCSACRHTGYRGRLGIFELLPTPPAVHIKLQKMGAQTPTAALLPKGGQTLIGSALERVGAGETSLKEVLRALGPDAAR